MLLWVAGHAEVELGTWVLDGCAVGKLAFVEAYHLPDEVGGVGMTARGRGKAAVLLGLVATQQHEIPDAEELEIQQFVFRLIDGRSATDDVWLHRNMVAVLDGGCYGDGAWAPADALSLELSVVQLLIYIFRVVCCDVDECRIERHQLVDGAAQGAGAVSLQRRQPFKGEPALVGILFVDIVCYCHKLYIEV